MLTETTGCELEYNVISRNGTVQVSAILDGQIIHADKLDISRATSRERFSKALVSKHPDIARNELDHELLRIVNEVMPTATEPVGYMPEVDVSRIVRPELFHSSEVSGVAVPVVVLTAGEPVGR